MLAELRAIEELKYRYLRHLDLKQWDELAATLTEDCVASYASGEHHYEGREAILGFLRENLGMPTRLTVHQVHHPEITLESETTARGVWALQDVVIDTELEFTIRGAAYYEDAYRKSADGWQISGTGYTRTYEEIESRDRPGLDLVANRFLDH